MTAVVIVWQRPDKKRRGGVKMLKRAGVCRYPFQPHIHVEERCLTVNCSR